MTPSPEYPDHWTDDDAPRDGEAPSTYVRRYTELGYEESLLRKMLVHFYGNSIEAWDALFEEAPEARLRFIELLHGLAPNRTDHSFILKIAKSCGIDRERAAHWHARWKEWRPRERDDPVRTTDGSSPSGRSA